MKNSLSIIMVLISFLFSGIELSLGIIDETQGSIEILINTDSDITGFQFDLEGANLTGGSGGIAEDSGFDIYASGDTTLGFSLEGNIIPSGSNGVLTILEGTINGDVCLPFIENVGPEDDTPIFSDSEGNALADSSIGNGGCTLFNEEQEISFSLFETYPNPFNPQLNIKVSIPENSIMNISAYNLNGQHIETIYNDFANSNILYDLNWDASSLSSGLYIIKVDASNFQYSKIVSLLK